MGAIIAGEVSRVFILLDYQREKSEKATIICFDLGDSLFTPSYFAASFLLSVYFI